MKELVLSIFLREKQTVEKELPLSSIFFLKLVEVENVATENQVSLVH